MYYQNTYSYPGLHFITPMNYYQPYSTLNDILCYYYNSDFSYNDILYDWTDFLNYRED